MAKSKVAVKLDKQLEYDLIDDFKKYAKEINKAIVKLGVDRQTHAAKGIMSQYYGEYTPKWYERTWNLRFNSTIKPYKNSKSKQGGVTISSEGMTDYEPRTFGAHPADSNKEPRPAALIWYSMWIQGYHGFDGKILYRGEYADTPYQELINARDRMQPRIKKQAIQVAQKQRYKALKF